ncbi:AAA family ATPase [Streptomyces sp. DG2A-72]|uniref:AAA family ATPase n=1 Tax=Streptomyces sp. DG2A-72 TaxID=3051386 RepID=UPI00265BB40C|nr:AAA family ATPase [Streptomyces sp. DG2A-72]MDO0937140.1 AAA family ATPase [Streptomyces sp. DG2A-72]
MNERLWDPTGGSEVGHVGAPPPSENPTQARLADLRGQLLGSAELDQRPDPVPLISGVLYQDSIAWMYGKPGSGKSFAALDMACCVAAGGMAWQGHPTETGPVVFLVAEGISGTGKRKRAWEEEHGITTGVLFLPVPVQLLNGIDLGALLLLLTEIQPVLVVIDTQARCTIGVNENDNGAMSNVVAAVDQIRTATGACVLLVHHSGRSGENLRGASALDGAATTVIKVSKDSMYIELVSEKQKDVPDFEPVLLRTKPVGESLVLESRGGGTNTESEETVLHTLRDCFGTTSATGTKLLEESGLKKSTFYRALNALLRKGLVQNIGTQKRPVYALPKGQEMLPSPSSPT